MVFAFERFDVFRCTIPDGPPAVIQYGGLLEGNGLEARLWSVSRSPTTHQVAWFRGILHIEVLTHLELSCLAINMLPLQPEQLSNVSAR
jgi:hypothetical protein